MRYLIHITERIPMEHGSLVWSADFSPQAIPCAVWLSGIILTDKAHLESEEMISYVTEGSY